MDNNNILEIQAVLCYLVEKKDGIIQSIWLAQKKRKIGIGKYNGYGGKIEHNQNEITCIVAETFDESGVKVQTESLKKIGVAIYHNAYKTKDYVKFIVHTYIATTWEGVPRETEEMGPPQKFSQDTIPYTQMLAGDTFTLPCVIREKSFLAEIYYTKEGTVITSYVHKTKSFNHYD